jgi:hypothetical protein
MAAVFITSTEPFSTMTPSTSVFTDVTNKVTVKVTPDRLDRWLLPVNDTLEALPKGTRACSVVPGEPLEAGVLVIRERKLKKLKVQMVQREIILEVCKSFPTFHDL